MIIKILNLALGGLVGTLARYFLSGAAYKILGVNFPYGTLVVNSAGCLAAGFLFALAESKFLLNPNARLLLLAGFCGAFTTFSTFILETNSLLKDGEILKAFLNIFVSVSLGFLLFRLGAYLGEIL